MIPGLGLAQAEGNTVIVEETILTIPQVVGEGRWVRYVREEAPPTEDGAGPIATNPNREPQEFQFVREQEGTLQSGDQFQIINYYGGPGAPSTQTTACFDPGAPTQPLKDTLGDPPSPDEAFCSVCVPPGGGGGDLSQEPESYCVWCIPGDTTVSIVRDGKEQSIQDPSTYSPNLGSTSDALVSGVEVKDGSAEITTIFQKNDGTIVTVKADSPLEARPGSKGWSDACGTAIIPLDPCVSGIDEHDQDREGRATDPQTWRKKICDEARSKPAPA